MNCLSLSSVALRMQLFDELQPPLLASPNNGAEGTDEVDQFAGVSAKATVDLDMIGSDTADRGEKSTSCRAWYWFCNDDPKGGCEWIKSDDILPPLNSGNFPPNELLCLKHDLSGFGCFDADPHVDFGLVDHWWKFWFIIAAFFLTAYNYHNFLFHPSIYALAEALLLVPCQCHTTAHPLCDRFIEGGTLYKGERMSEIVSEASWNRCFRLF